ncbi:hypothetical protein HMN09_00162900 [Mycena chlorophos]|uniref:Uncharacterized protein n=1 Tax=Mycena chlorophos TaxID=658473 RepID=A0A8H6WQF5_MYCCL|nr:hypothetical protein HMN09_00162900 [Mycena chlorophos]
MSKETSKLVPSGWHTTYFPSSQQSQPHPQAQPGPSLPVTHYHTIVIHERSQQDRRRRRGSCCRFLALFFIAWLLVHAAVHHLRKYHGCHGLHCRDDNDWLSSQLGIVDANIPEDIVIERCLHNGQLLKHNFSETAAKTTSPALGFTFPIATNTTITFTYHQSFSSFFDLDLVRWWSWFVSRLRFSAVEAVVFARPTLQVTTTDSLTDTAEVSVSSSTGTTVCQMQGRDGTEIGIVIFSLETALDPQLTLRLPEATTNTPRWKQSKTIKALNAYLPNFAINVAGHLALQSLRLTATNAPISLGTDSLQVSERVDVSTTNAALTAKNITAPHLSLTTTNAAIRGSFNASESLVLRTTNAPIDVNVGLENNKGTPSPTSGTLTTTNGNIDARIRLSTPPKLKVGGSFGLTASTTNKRAFIDVVDAPEGHKLMLSTHTTNAPAEVRVPLEYEGALSVYASERGGASVQRKHKDDGDSRVLSVQQDPRGRSVHGAIYKDDEGKTRGSVGVSTTNAKAVVIV